MGERGGEAQRLTPSLIPSLPRSLDQEVPQGKDCLRRSLRGSEESPFPEVVKDTFSGAMDQEP